MTLPPTPYTSWYVVPVFLAREDMHVGVVCACGYGVCMWIWCVHVDMVCACGYGVIVIFLAFLLVINRFLVCISMNSEHVCVYWNVVMFGELEIFLST